MNITSIDLNLLVTFEALFVERHLSRAATRVGLSQPAMSNALRRLRLLLNDPLFIRGSRGMTPTARATQLAEPVRIGLAHLRTAMDDRSVFDPATTLRNFRIAINDYAELRLAGAISRELRKHAPGVQIEFRRTERLFVPPVEDLRTGVLDAAIGFFADPGTRVRELWVEEHVLIARRGHPILKRKITRESFAAAAQTAVFYKTEPRGLIDNVLAAHQLERRLQMKTPHFLTVPATVAASDLIACIPLGLARIFAPSLNLVVRRLPFDLPPASLRLVWHERTDGDPAQQWLRSQLVRIAS